MASKELRRWKSKKRKEKKRKEKNEKEIKLIEMTSFRVFKNSIEKGRLKQEDKQVLAAVKYELGRKPLSAIAAFLNR